MMKMIKPIALVALALVMSILVFAVVWYLAGSRPVDSQNQVSQVFTVEAGSGVSGTAAALKQAGLIRDKQVFELYVTIFGLRSKLQAGTYSLAPNKSLSEITGVITKGSVAEDKLVIPEGLTEAQITDLAVKKGYDRTAFNQALKGTYSNAFLAGRTANSTLEGYLFPDSYTVGADHNPTALIQAMLDNFGRQLTPQLKAAYDAQGLTLNQAVTLASIVEKEVSNADDRPVVAQVFLSRIKAGQPLGSDITVLYAAKLMNKSFDVGLDSPYNTYKVKGLPPGPVSNPGLSALQAVAKPATTTYLYFLSGKDGTTYFAHTFAEHQANVAKYLK